MLKKLRFVLVLSLCFTMTSGGLFSQGNYQKEWDEVKTFQDKNLPKSALSVVEKILKSARQDKNHAQIIKSLLHKFQYLMQVEENSSLKIYQSLKEELKNSVFPLTPLLHSLSADLLWSYYQQNRWKFLNRSVTTQVKEENIDTWDLQTLVETVQKQIQLSLASPDKLKATKIDLYDPILHQRKENRYLRPTLYDFLMHRAIDFYMESEAGVTQPALQFDPQNPVFLGDNEKFVQKAIQTPDPSSFSYLALLYLQELTRYHLATPDPQALLALTLKRLAYAYRLSNLSNKATLYRKTLLKLIHTYKKNPMVSEVYHALAVFYNEQGDLYRPLVSTRYKWLKKKALRFCQEAIDRYPNTFGAYNCAHLRDTIKFRRLQLTLEKHNLPGEPFRALLEYRNLEKMYYKIFPFDPKNMIDEDYDTKKMLARFLGKTPSNQGVVSLPKETDYQIHKTEIMFPSLKSGNYILIASNKEDFNLEQSSIAHSRFQVTRVSYVERVIPEGLEIRGIDRKTSLPLSRMSASLWVRQHDSQTRRYYYQQKRQFTADAQGVVVIPRNQQDYYGYYLELESQGDKFFGENYYYQSHYHEYYADKTQIKFFTDRSIYRPGQTIFFKGILYQNHFLSPEENKVIARQPVNVAFYDTNNQQIHSLRLTSNEFGTVQGSFTVPQGVLNGRMRIAAHNGGTFISVEEYKRPQFEVKIETPQRSFALNETISLKGQALALAGYAIDNAKVKYTVSRLAYFPYRWLYYWYFTQPKPTQIAVGELKTDGEGNFTLQFKALPDLQYSKKNLPAFLYTISADVTDLNGETQSAKTNLHVGYTSIKLNLSLPGEIDKRQKNPLLHFTVTNLGDKELPGQGNIQIEQLETPATFLRNRQWEQPDRPLMSREEYAKNFPHDAYAAESDFSRWKALKTVARFNFDTTEKKERELQDIQNWEPGKYRITMSSKDKGGAEVKEIAYFNLIDSRANKLALPALGWVQTPTAAYEPGETLKLLVGTSAQNVKILYEVEHRQKIVTQKYLTLNEEQTEISLPIEESFRGNVTLRFIFVKHNQLVSEQRIVRVPWSNKDLSIQFETFREQLKPGDKESWRLRISGPAKDKIAAEMVGSLYDASLDHFLYHGYDFSVFPSFYPRLSFRTQDLFNTIRTQNHGRDYNQYSSYYQRYYDSLNLFGFYWRHYYQYRGLRYAKSSSRRANGEKELGAVPEEAPMAEMAKKSLPSAPKNGAKDESPEPLAAEKPAPSQETGKSAPELQIRSNFNETAFFYPQLKTDEKGEILIEFTLPDSLTRWKFLGLAHTKDLAVGSVVKELKARKDLMVIPNAPRFLREKDTIMFTAKVVNMSENPLSGQASLELLDAFSGQSLGKLFQKSAAPQKFEAAKGKSAFLSWTLQIPPALGAVTYRIIARTPDFADGEERTLPILTNRMLVTESLPLPVRGEQTKQFELKKMTAAQKSSTLSHHKLTLEFTANPVWYAVQALPYMMEYPYECTEQTFSRYYSNSIAAYIVRTNPQIKKVFEIWEKSGDSTALLSNLEKNQELKSLILEETPWLLDAKDEGERKKRVALLFDLNRMSSELDRALKKIREAQLPEGGWSWFKGMNVSPYITQYLVTGFARLSALKVLDWREHVEVKAMLDKAIPYLDYELKKDYDYLLRHKLNLKKNQLSYLQVSYLYARSYYQEIPIPAEVKTAFNFYLGQAKKFWPQFNKYLQGMLALALKRYQAAGIARDILRSIKEHAINSEEMGMYWKGDSGYYWYQAPIETQALLIEAFSEVVQDSKAVSDMKTWLLKQKQTQDWRTTTATATACYALLLGGENWLAESKEPVIKLAGQPVNEETKPELKRETGTGYFKVSWKAQEIKSEMGKVEVVNPNKNPAWGALYWQYFEDLDKITPHKTPLSLDKKVFIVTTGPKGDILTPITDNNPLKVGDKLKVRIILRVDRNMEFVHMKDMRAASFEPLNVLSRYKWQDGLGYYESTKDASTNFFFDYLPKGSYVFEYPLRVTHAGNFSNGITTIQCMYAPEFTSHSKGIRVDVKPQ